jgi:tRNA modification GTPase
MVNPIAFSDTIVAPATAPGRGALSIVRLSGPRAHRIASAALERWPDQPRIATLTSVIDSNGMEVDRSIVVRYDAPASFTGEDAVEIMTHGGLIVPTTVVAALIAHGARLAHPGEFTRRAVLNGKLDILQAEATGDLVNANSRAAQAVALRQLDGGLSRRVLALRDDLIELEALIAYDIDFPEEDDGPIAPARIESATRDVIHALTQLLATARMGELVREGALVVLAGLPNVGKSSLFNALLGQSRAIVTELPGTTRDAIEAVLDTPVIPLRLVDTAGMRDALDPVERIGVEVGASYASRASVVAACGDTRESLDAIIDALSSGTTAPIVAVRTKTDLSPPPPDELVSFRIKKTVAAAFAVSAETGQGLAELATALAAIAAGGANAADTDAPLLTQERHRYAIARALDETRAFSESRRSAGVPATVAAVHVRAAIGALEDLIGAVDVDDILDEVFRRFCVGK